MKKPDGFFTILGHPSRQAPMVSISIDAKGSAKHRYSGMSIDLKAAEARQLSATLEALVADKDLTPEIQLQDEAWLAWASDGLCALTNHRFTIFIGAGGVQEVIAALNAQADKAELRQAIVGAPASDAGDL